MATAVLAALIVVVALGTEERAFVAPASGHEAPSGWSYPENCCGGDDCAPLPAGALKYTAGSWLVVATGETIPFTKVRPSPDGRNHRCRMDGDDPKSATTCTWEVGGERCCLWIGEAQF